MSLRRFLLAGLLMLLATRAGAHAGSSAFLWLEWTPQAASLRWDLALRDADVALGLDADGDGRITWGETRAAEPALRGYAREHLALSSSRGDCRLDDAEPLQVVERDAEHYAVLRFAMHCPQAPAALAYSGLFALDASHRLLLRARIDGREQAGVLAPALREFHFADGAADAGAVFGAYFHEGLRHVLEGWDHLLFLLALFLPAALRREQGRWLPVGSLREAVLSSAAVVTAFTLAHAVTLCLAALGVLSLPSRLVESAVAASVLFAGLNNLLPMVRRRLAWLAAGFGLIHGSAIAGALLELGLPAQGRVAALAGFNLGVEVAQLALVALLVPLAYPLRGTRAYLRVVLWPGSALVALAGLVWLLDRAFALDLPLPI